MAAPLTDALTQRIAKLFALSDQERVASVLIEECGGNLTGSLARRI
jgi:hypothetical protein